MTGLRTAVLFMIASVGLTDCMSEGIDGDSNQDIVQITHTTKASLYWE
jgi:hypothetical protein